MPCSKTKSTEKVKRMGKNTGNLIKVGLGAAAEIATQTGHATSPTGAKIASSLTRSPSGHLGQQIVQSATAAAPVVAAAVAAVGFGAYKLYEWLDS